ncbi:MAG: hypothetical protein V5A21_11215, partial [Halapricum sp.]
TGGTTTDEGRADVLGSLDCEAFDGDPGVAHVTDYEIERTLRGGSELIVTAVTIYRCARTLSCGRPGTDLQRSL